MTATEILETVSERVLKDERILSTRERELIANLLRHARNSNGCSAAVTQTIARAIGEVVAERTNLLLGEGVLRRLSAEFNFGEKEAYSGIPPVTNPPVPNDPVIPRPPGPNPPGISAGTPPYNPPPGPDPNMPRPPGPNPPGISAGTPPYNPPPGPDPNMPRPPGPNPPGIRRETEIRQDSAVAVAELEEVLEFLPANCVVLDEVLTPAELRSLTEYALSHEKDFRVSEVIAPGGNGGGINYESRRSRVLMDPGPHEGVLVNRLRAALPMALRKLGRPEFEITRVETQITASNDGDYFRWHSDNGQGEISRREITFVYFFHHEPRPFTGGELRIYDSLLKNGTYVPGENYRVVVPQQNQAVLFVSSMTHEITPVEVLSRSFADSRFTVNGWFRK